jgi:hypothetical protein
MSIQFEKLRLGDLGPDVSIWRYLTFPKFVSMLETQALWFSKLSILALADTLEGMTPELTRAQMKSQHREMEKWFPDEQRKQQVRCFVEDNEANGRELIVANCWFIGEQESQNMWDNYAGNEGVVVRSTGECLANSLCLSHECWWMGKVNYVDLASYDQMDVYQGQQARHRAFLKSEQYAFENELRVATMNWVAPGCLNPDGSPPTEKQKSGWVYSPDRSGVFVSTHLAILMKEVRTAPGTSEWHHNLVGLLVRNANIPCPVVRSGLKHPTP